jgi:hypothetical protein
MIKVKTLKEASKYLTIFSKVLRKYSFPKVSVEIEDEFIPYKTWNFKLDGYDVCVHFTEFLLHGSVIQNLQVYPKKLYCLPFHVSIKVAVAFLGTEDLVTFNVTKDQHIVFCWTKLREDYKNGNVNVKRSIPKETYLGIKYGTLS